MDDIFICIFLNKNLSLKYAHLGTIADKSTLDKVMFGCLYADFKHDDVIKWKHFPRYWPFVRVIHRSPVNSPHKGQWRGALMFSLICVGINGWLNNCGAGDLRRYHAHYDVTVMKEHRLFAWLWPGHKKPAGRRLDFFVCIFTLFLLAKNHRHA